MYLKLKTDSVAVLGLYHIVYVALHHIRGVKHSSLNFKITEAHIKILCIDIIVFNKSTIILYLIKIISRIGAIELKGFLHGAVAEFRGGNSLAAALALRLAERNIMFSSALAVRGAVRAHEYLTAFAKLTGYLLQLFKVIVPVVVEYNQLITLFKLPHQRVVILYLLYR